MTNPANSVSTILGAAAGEQMRVSLFINHDIANRFYQSRSSMLRLAFFETFIPIDHDIAKHRLHYAKA